MEVLKVKTKTNFNLAERIDYGVKAGVREAIIEHKRAGKSIFILEKGKIDEIPADQIQVADDQPKQPK